MRAIHEHMYARDHSYTGIIALIRNRRDQRPFVCLRIEDGLWEKPAFGKPLGHFARVVTNG
jgi:hypothetical protein